MKLVFILSFTISCLFGFSQADNQKNNTFYQQECLISNLKIEEFKNKIFENEKTKVIYFFSYSCPSSDEFTPLLKDFFEKNNNVDLYVVTPKNLNNSRKICNYLFYKGWFSFPIYTIDKKYKHIVNSLCSDCEEKIMGYSDFFILNSKNELIYQTNYNQNSEEKIELLDKIIE